MERGGRYMDVCMYVCWMYSRQSLLSLWNGMIASPDSSEYYDLSRVFVKILAASLPRKYSKLQASASKPRSLKVSPLMQHALLRERVLSNGVGRQRSRYKLQHAT